MDGFEVIGSGRVVVIARALAAVASTPRGEWMSATGESRSQMSLAAFGAWSGRLFGRKPEGVHIVGRKKPLGWAAPSRRLDGSFGGDERIVGV